MDTGHPWPFMITITVLSFSFFVIPSQITVFRPWCWIQRIVSPYRPNSSRMVLRLCWIVQQLGIENPL